MGEHSAPESSWVRVARKALTAGKWVATHRRKLYAVAVVVIPLASRYVPDFPSDAFLDVLRAFLGA